MCVEVIAGSTHKALNRVPITLLLWSIIFISAARMKAI